LRAPYVSHRVDQTHPTHKAESICRVCHKASLSTGYTALQRSFGGTPTQPTSAFVSMPSTRPNRDDPPHSYLGFALHFSLYADSLPHLVVIPVDSRKPQNAGRAPPSPTPDSAFSVHSNQPGHSYWPPTPVARDLVATAAIGTATKGDTKNVVASHSVNGGRRNSLPEDASDHVSLRLSPAIRCNKNKISHRIQAEERH
jgi:hypothetical protein